MASVRPLLSAIASRVAMDRLLVGQQLILIALIPRPIRDDALHVDESDRTRRAAPPEARASSER